MPNSTSGASTIQVIINNNQIEDNRNNSAAKTLSHKGYNIILLVPFIIGGTLKLIKLRCLPGPKTLFTVDLQFFQQ
jgi:hypothetical protein